MPTATGTPAAAITTLALSLLHGERRGEHAGMRVGDAQDLQQALDRAVLAEAAVQRVEGDVGLELARELSAMSRCTSMRVTR